MSSVRPFVGCAAAAKLAVVAAAIILAACSQQLPPRSPAALMSDPAVLQGVLFRCNQLQNAALRDAECRNAREAVDRLASQEGTDEQEQEHAEEAASFEKAREALRARDERERLRRESQMDEQPDPYTLPLVPEQPDAPLQTIVVSAASPPADR